MPWRKDGKPERICATAMAITEADTKRNTREDRRLRALRLAKEAGTKAPQEERLSTAVVDD
jgi:hypothetical protein